MCATRCIVVFCCFLSCSCSCCSCCRLAYSRRCNHVVLLYLLFFRVVVVVLVLVVAIVVGGVPSSSSSLLFVVRHHRLASILPFVETSSATTESRVESDDPSVCPAPGASSSARSYAAVVAGQSATQGLCSLVRSQRSEVNFRRSC